MESKFLNELKEILEVEDRDLSLSDQFREYPEWDSLANLSVIAMIDEEYGVVIENSEFRKIQTLGQLVEEIKRRVEAL
ncbi:MAG: acyl carrier protein [Mongoliitalea sp.]